MTAFIRAGQTEDKAALLRSVARHESPSRYDIDPQQFGWIPGSPFAYWVSESVRSLFRSVPSFGARSGNAVRQGLATADDFRFVRTWWEVNPREERWRPMAKGGPLATFYADIPLVVNWLDDGREIRNFTKGSDRPASRVQNVEFFFRPGLTWPLRASRFCPQPLPAGVVISVRGSGIYGPAISEFAGLGSSSIVDALLKMMSGRFGHPQFDMGDIAQVPVPDINPQQAQELASLARSAWSARRSEDSATEGSHAFTLPALLWTSEGSMVDRAELWLAHVARVDDEVARIQERIDELCFDIYGIGETDRRSIAEGFGASDDGATHTDEDESDDSDSDGHSSTALEPEDLVAGLVSWAVGVAAGRLDVRLATGERERPAEPDPFEPLPMCPPGMLTGVDGLSLAVAPDRYPLGVSAVLVDDPGHELDLAARVRTVFDVVFGGDADRWWTDVGAVLDPRTGVVDAWLRKGFFDYHLKTYSKSRRKAPIVWPLGTRSGSYRVWLYAHRVTPDSLFRVLNDIVGPKLHVEERRLSELRQDAGLSPSASQRKAIDAQETFVAELREFRDELAAVAPLWAPDLNDGVVIVLAPLWRLFAHHRAWSSELKDRWRKLAAGDYDWAQLAMRLWPERVIPKCADDRSLAVAHGLEDVFWVADKDNPDKWRPRTIPTTPVEELIAARANPTITTARQHPTP